MRWKGRRYGKELVKGWGVREGERIRGVRKGREGIRKKMREEWKEKGG